MVGNCFDDCLIIADQQVDKDLSMQESGKFDRFTGQRVGHQKTVAFSSPHAEDDKLISLGVRLKSVDAKRPLVFLCKYTGRLAPRCTTDGLKNKIVITMTSMLLIPEDGWGKVWLGDHPTEPKSCKGV